MSRFSEKVTVAFRQFPSRFFETLRRYSGTLVLLALLYLILDLEAYTGINVDSRLVLLLPLGAIALFAADLFFESRLASWYVRWSIKAGLLLLLALTFPTVERYELRPMLLFVASVALFGWAACIAYGDRTEETLGVLIVRGATSVLFALVLYLGLWLILWGMDLLLIHISGKVYGELARFCFILFAPLMFLYGVPKPGEEKSLLRGYQQLLRVVVLPLLGVFLAVLYCYYIKLIVTAQLPISELGGVSLVFLCINLPMLFLAKPFCTGGFARLRTLLLYGTLPVFLVLFFTAGRQVALYGVSVTRYIVLIGGGALLLCVFFLLFGKGKFRSAIFAVLFVTALISCYGPQSCYSLTRFSQHGRLTAALAEAGMLDGGVVMANPDAESDLQREILELIDYCSREDLELPDCFPIPYNYDNMKDILGFDRSTLPDTQSSAVWHHYPVNEPVDLGDGGYLLPRGGIYNFETSCGTLEVDTTSDFTIICDGGVLCSLNQAELRDSVLKAVQEQDVAASYIYTLESEKLFAKIPFSYISDPDPQIHGDWDYAYIKVK